MSLLIPNQLFKTLLPFILGAFCVLGFAPFYFYPASVISLIGLFYFWFSSHTIKQTLLTGFLYGLGLYTVGIYWIYISLHTYGGMPVLMAGISTFLLAAFMALFPMLVGLFSARLTRRQQNMAVLAVPVLWALSDWVRSWIFTGFPWLTLGYSQVPDSPLAGFMPVIGVYGVSWLTAMIASLTAFGMVKKDLAKCWRRNAIVATVLVLLLGHWLKSVEWTASIGKPISVSLLQGNVEQSLKWAPEIAERTIHEYLVMAEASKAKLIVMPETALPVVSSELPDEAVARLRQHAIKNQGDILVGMIERENGEYFNSVLSFGSDSVQPYRKSHLVPFGEFIPFKIVFGWIYRDWLNMPLSDLSRGSIKQQPMPVAGVKVAVNICYEDVFGEEIIRQLPEATLLVNVSNDAWYGDSFAANQHLQFSQARALETGRMVLRATNTGATAMIDTHGQLVVHAPHLLKATLNGRAQAYSGVTPYVRWGNWPFVMLSFALIAFLLRGNAVAWLRRVKACF